MTFAHTHFYNGLVLETNIHLMTNLIYDRHTSKFMWMEYEKSKIIHVFNNHYIPQEY
jgi:hypothetical protein